MKISWTVLKLQSGRDFVLETATSKLKGAQLKMYKNKSYSSCILHVI